VAWDRVVGGLSASARKENKNKNLSNKFLFLFFNRIRVGTPARQAMAAYLPHDPLSWKERRNRQWATW
jgi:hypothetical protein